MGFWGSLGKGLLKVAPIAAAFIPGVGPLASMAIGGLASGASKKLSGGSWKDALVSGGIGAASGYGAGVAAKGLGPTAGLMSKVKSGASQLMGGGGGGGWASTLGNTLQNIQGTMGGLQPQMAQQQAPAPYQMEDSTVASDPLGQRRRQGGLAPSFARGAAMAS